MDAIALNDMLKGLLMKDLRIQCRARGITPAGSREALLERLRDNMLETGDFTLKEEGAVPPAGSAFAPALAAEDDAPRGNNYSRPEGQNVGNFLTDRPSSRVLAAPGGASHVVLGDADLEPAKKAEGAKASTLVVDATGMSLHMGTEKHVGVGEHTSNNYGRPEGQNVGNFITDRSSSRVLAPPGGASQISFG